MSEPSNFLNTRFWNRFANQAFINKDWELSVLRWRKLLDNEKSNDIAHLKLSESLREAGYLNEAIEILNSLNFGDSTALNESHSREKAKTYMAFHQWEIALTYWGKVKITNLRIMQCMTNVCKSSIIQS